jgi:hypothetical protein
MMVAEGQCVVYMAVYFWMCFGWASPQERRRIVEGGGCWVLGSEERFLDASLGKWIRTI